MVRWLAGGTRLDAWIPTTNRIMMLRLNVLSNNKMEGTENLISFDICTPSSTNISTFENTEIYNFYLEYVFLKGSKEFSYKNLFSIIF